MSEHDEHHHGHGHAMRVTGVNTPSTLSTATAASAAVDTVGIDVMTANAVMAARAGAGVPARPLGGTLSRAKSRSPG